MEWESFEEPVSVCTLCRREAGLKPLAAILLSLMLSLVLLPRRAHAGEPDWVEYSGRVSIPLTTVGLSVWLAGEFFKKDLVPDQSRWSAGNPVDDGVRRALAWNLSRQGTADMASNVVLGAIPLIGLFPLLAGDNNGWSLSGDRPWKQTGLSALVMLESVSVALLANQIVKFIVLRDRPYTRQPGFAGDKPDQRLSFYSGHTTTAFALAVSAATLYDMKGGDHRGVVWAVSLALASSVGYLRIAADKHYLTDVFVGAVVGAVAGFFLPRLLHRPASGKTEEFRSGELLPVVPDPWIFGMTLPW